MQEITWKITKNEADLILNTVAQLPYNQCFTVIEKLQKQANEQLKGDTRKYDDIANKKLAEVEKVEEQKNEK